MRPGREYAATYAFRSLVESERFLSAAQIVPKVGEIDFFASFDERFGRRTVKPKMPQIVVVIRELPSRNTGEESVHHDELLDFSKELRGIGVGTTMRPMSCPTTRAFVSSGGPPLQQRRGSGFRVLQTRER
jgi:hypothetical protein